MNPTDAATDTPHKVDASTGDMSRGDVAAPEPPLQVATMAEGERVAIRLLRRILGSRGAGPAELDESPALDHAAMLIRRAVDPDAGGLSRPIDVALPEDAAVTPDERTLLRALAAAQHAEEPLLDQAVSRLMPAREKRSSLAEAMRALARALATSGRSLANPRVLCWSLPAAALTVARLHGHDLGHIAIAWPPRD